MTAETSTCQAPLTFSWTGPDGFTSTSEDVSISPALPANTGTYKVVITDNFGCQDSITIDAISKPNAGSDFTVCAGSSTTIFGTDPNTGTWAESSSNGSGASLNPLAGGATEVTFSSAVSGTYDMVYSIPDNLGGSCSDTMRFTVDPVPSLSLGASQVCENSTITATSDIAGGTWTSGNVAIATIDPVTGIITGESSGVTTFTYTAPTGCTSVTNPLTVNEAPTVTAPNGNIVCVADIISVTPSVGGTWMSDDELIVTVTDAGMVEGISEGTATLTFTNTATGCTSVGLNITVPAVPVATYVGSDSICINATTSLTPATGGTWVSSDPAVASIDNGGNVTGLSVGKAVFTYTNTVSGCFSAASDTLWVLADPIVAFTGDDRLCIGENSSVSPNTGGTWMSNDPSVATIDMNTGMITAVGQGATTFIFTDAISGCLASTPSMIVDPNPSVSTVFDSICITATTTISPSVGGTWQALDPGIASLIGTTVTGVSSGDARFLFTTNASGCVSDTLFVYVRSIPATVLTGPNQICIDSTTTIEPAIGGTWTSSDPSIATIDNFGNITGVAAGMATFTFTNASSLCASDPSVPVEVFPLPIVSAPLTDLCITETMTLSPGAGGFWTSSDPTVATVGSFDGIVTAISDGLVFFTYVSSDGCVATTDVVTVKCSTRYRIYGTRSNLCWIYDISHSQFRRNLDE